MLMTDGTNIPRVTAREARHALDIALGRVVLAAVALLGEARRAAVLAFLTDAEEKQAAVSGLQPLPFGPAQAGHDGQGVALAAELRGCLAAFRRFEVAAMVDLLVDCALVEIAARPRRLVLTPQGIEYLAGRIPEPLGIFERLYSFGDPAAASRRRALRLLRSALATREGTSRFFVFTEETLRLLAARPPQTLPELAAVRGLGPHKIARFGEDLLRLLRTDHQPLPSPPPEPTLPATST